MGTETQCEYELYTHDGNFIVKLNNPLMGTETLILFILYLHSSKQYS